MFFNKKFKFVFLLSIFFNNILNACDEDPKNVYVLKTGHEAEQALEEQHKILEKDSYEHLRRAGLSAGHIVWDIGCGSGVMTEYLAKAVGTTGHVYAFDISLDQIDVAKERMKKVGLENVTFIQGDIYSLDRTYFNSADLVYARFVLMHLIRPREALTKIHNLLKSGGVFVSQESIMKTSYFSTKVPELEDYTKTLIALGVHKGVDYNIGDKLKNLCLQTYFKEVDDYFIQRKLAPQQVKFILLKRIDEWSDKAIEANLTTLDDIEKWRNSIEEFSKYDSPAYYALAKQAYTLAKK